MKKFVNILRDIIDEQITSAFPFAVDPVTKKELPTDYSIDYRSGDQPVRVKIGDRSTNCLVKTAEKYIDESVYSWGAGPEDPECINEPGKGCVFDCSSFINHVFEECGYTVDIPRTTNGMWSQLTSGTGGAKKRDTESDVRVGDLVFFDTQPDVGPVGHVALIVNTSPLQMVHSCSRGVAKDNVKDYGEPLVGYGSYL
jgi:cell wall-associated NlpC family hydrolase